MQNNSQNIINSQNKLKTRIQYKLYREQLDIKEYNNKLIIKALIDNFNLNHNSFIATYYSINNEPNTIELIDYMYQHNIPFILPKVNKDNLFWSLYPTLLNKNKNKIIEPLSHFYHKNDILSKVDFIIIPSLTINKKGYRIGSGYGYYDKALMNINTYKIGYIYNHELIDVEYNEIHDIPLNAAILLTNTNYIVHYF